MAQTVHGMALGVLFVCVVTRALQCVGGPASRGAAAAAVRRGAATGDREAADDYASLQRSMERRGAAWRNERAAMARLDEATTAALVGRDDRGEDAARASTANARNAAIAADVETEILAHWQTLARRASDLLDVAADAFVLDVGVSYPAFLRTVLDSAACFPKHAAAPKPAPELPILTMWPLDAVFPR